MKFGLGLEKAGNQPDTMKRAFELGVDFFDTAPTYGYALNERMFGEAWKNAGVKRDKIFISTKTHYRNPEAALELLDKSLMWLQTDHVDLWSLHDLVADYDMVVTRAFDAAKKSGKAKYIGITCNRDPLLLKEMLKKYPFDYVMLPLNVADKHKASFIENVLPNVGKAKIIAMQIFMRGMSLYQVQPIVRSILKADSNVCPQDGSQMNLIWTKATPTSAKWVCKQCGYAGPEDPEGQILLKYCVDYTASFKPDVMLMGCNGVNQLEQDWALFNTISKMPAAERKKIENLTAPYKEQLNFYKAEFKKKGLT